MQITEDDANTPMREFDLAHSKDLSFAVGEGDGRHGLEVCRINANGKARYTFAKTAYDWRQLDYELPPHVVNELRALLLEVGFVSLPKCYIDTCIRDGKQVCLSVTSNGHTKKVYCSNYFPNDILRLSQWAKDQLLEKKDSKILNSVGISKDQARTAAADLWP